MSPLLRRALLGDPGGETLGEEQLVEIHVGPLFGDRRELVGGEALPGSEGARQLLLGQGDLEGRKEFVEDGLARLGQDRVLNALLQSYVLEEAHAQTRPHLKAFAARCAADQVLHLREEVVRHRDAGSEDRAAEDQLTARHPEQLLLLLHLALFGNQRNRHVLDRVGVCQSPLTAVGQRNALRRCTVQKQLHCRRRSPAGALYMQVEELLLPEKCPEVRIELRLARLLVRLIG